MRRKHAAAHLEHAPRVRVDDQIEIALAVAGLDVAQAVPLLGQRDEALRQELESGRPDRQLVRAGCGTGVRSTPMKSPKSSSLKICEVRARAASPAGCRSGSATAPSEMTRKFALPKLRIARIRPAVAVSTFDALELGSRLSRRTASRGRGPCECARRRAGMGSTPSLTS